jgi:hypothetical protein
MMALREKNGMKHPKFVNFFAQSPALRYTF